MDPGYILLNINSNWRNSNQRFPSMCVLYNLRKSVYSVISSQVAVAYSVVSRDIFEPLNRYGHPNIEPKYFTTRLLKDRRPPEKCILSQSRYSKF